jgi:hypothetical protein
MVDGGGNLSWGDTTCPGKNADPKLLALADNGGPTLTMALGAGSGAIDGAVNCPPPATDQRGVTRPRGARCDIGAYELQAPPTPTSTPTKPPTSTPPPGPTSTPTLKPAGTPKP